MTQPVRNHPVRRAPFNRAWLATGLLVLLAPLASACSSRDVDAPVTELVRAEDIASPTEGRAIDEALMLALAQAKNFHRKADVYLQDGRVEQAMAAVRQVQSVRFPPDSPEAEDVRLDARARLAKLQLAAGDLSGASNTVAEGLANASRESFFVANLYTVRGEILEARAAAATDSGDEQGAKDLRRQAIEALDRSIAINQTLQRELVEGAR